MNNMTKTQPQTKIALSKEQQILMPIAESYIAMFPDKQNDTTKQNIISMALRLSEVKDKTGRAAVDVCTKESILQVAQEVIVKKLDLMKNQGALIVRGNKLMLQSQYQGNVARALELNPFLSHFNFVPIYKDDKVEMEIGDDGSYNIKRHDTSFANIGNNNIVGGYVRAIKKDGSVYMTEVMTMEQIKIAWSKSSNSSLSVHKEFPLKMVRKTILNSLCSWLINTTGEREEDFVQGYEDQNATSAIDIDFDQDYSDIEEGEEGSDQEQFEPLYEDEQQTADESIEQDDNNEEEITVGYSEWVNTYKLNGYTQIKGSYDPVEKTVRVKKC